MWYITFTSVFSLSGTYLSFHSMKSSDVCAEQWEPLNPRDSVSRCAAGFLGEYCQHEDPCQPGHCLNRGTCSVSMPNGVPVPGSALCTCPLGYTGERCQTPQNSTCYPNNPCANGGVCTLLSLDKYKCECARGWTGERFWQDKDSLLFENPLLPGNVASVLSVDTQESLTTCCFFCQVHIVNMRIAVCPVPVPMKEHAALSLVANTPVAVVLATKVPAASTTQTNVQKHPPPVRTTARVSTPPAPSSESKTSKETMFGSTRVLDCNNQALPLPQVRLQSRVHGPTLRKLLRPVLAVPVCERRHLPPDLRNQLLMSLPPR